MSSMFFLVNLIHHKYDFKRNISHIINRAIQYHCTNSNKNYLAIFVHHFLLELRQKVVIWKFERNQLTIDSLLIYKNRASQFTAVLHRQSAQFEVVTFLFLDKNLHSSIIIIIDVANNAVADATANQHTLHQLLYQNHRKQSYHLS